MCDSATPVINHPSKSKKKSIYILDLKGLSVVKKDDSIGAMVSRNRVVFGTIESIQESDLPHTISNGESTVEDDQSNFEGSKGFQMPVDKARTLPPSWIYDQSISARQALSRSQAREDSGYIMPHHHHRHHHHHHGQSSHGSAFQSLASARVSEHPSTPSFRPFQRQIPIDVNDDLSNPRNVPERTGQIRTTQSRMIPLATHSSRSLVTQTSCRDTADAVAALLDLTPSVNANVQDHKSRPEVARAPDRNLTSESTEKAASEQRPQTEQGDIGAYMAITSIDLASRSRQLLFDVPVTEKACKCKNTHCLKLYCTCFQTGTFCDPNLCTCKGCQNLEAFNGPNDSRPRAISQILKRRIDAFEPRLKKKTGEGMTSYHRYFSYNWLSLRSHACFVSFSK